MAANICCLFNCIYLCAKEKAFHHSPLKSGINNILSLIFQFPFLFAEAS